MAYELHKPYSGTNYSKSSITKTCPALQI